MEKTEILLKLKEIIEKQLNSKLEITEYTGLIGEKILDSLEFMNYLTIVEETFDVNISDSDILNYQLGKIDNMIDYLKLWTNKQ